MHLLTVDFEQWYEHLRLDLSDYKEEEILPRSIDLLQRTLNEHNTKALIFFLAKDAEHFPDLVRSLSLHHDIGIHGYEHRLVNQMSLSEFREDVLHAKRTLEDICHKPITRYRAPGFSLLDGEYLQILAQCGIKEDYSLAACRHQYGRRILQSDQIQKININGHSIIEYPPSVFNLLGIKGFIGGGYLRILPKRLIYHLISQRDKNGRDTIIYIHPRDFCPSLPRVNTLTPWQRFKFYFGQKSISKKISFILSEFDFPAQK